MPEVTHRSTRVRTTIEYAVTDVPPVAMRYSRTGRNFLPDRLTVVFHDDDDATASLSGPRILKTGPHGERLSQGWAGWEADGVPEWVKPYLVRPS